MALSTTITATLKDRIVGSILGVFIGDALGMGVHWQYNLDKLENDRGYVKDYLDPLPGTYHSGTPDSPAPGALKAGQLEIQGEIDKILLESLAVNKRLDQSDFHKRLEAEILRESTMDGTRQGGRWGWTDKSICELYRDRVVNGKEWVDCISPRSDTPDAIVRAALIAALYNATPLEMCKRVQEHASALTGDSSAQAHAVAFACLVAGVIQGCPINAELSGKLYSQAGKVLPFTTVHHEEMDVVEGYGKVTEPDSLLWFGQVAQGLVDCKTRPSPVHRGVSQYGKFCAFFAVVPSAYYCVASYPNSFEDAILCAVNGGGQTTMRASLVGALLGASVGLGGIPKRFVDGLDGSKELIELAKKVADAAIERSQSESDDKWDWPEKLDEIGVKK